VASLNKLSALRELLVETKKFVYRKVWGMDLHPSCTFSLSVRFDFTYPKGVHVGADTYIAFDVAILAHDRTRRMYVDTWIGERCFIGARSIIMPGIRIGDECVVGAGSVVVADVPPRSIVAGNPAKIIRSNISVGRFGQFEQKTDTRIGKREEMAETLGEVGEA
jgi:acetyltransferase-like isoleucine patch superfamily enzyme